MPRFRFLPPLAAAGLLLAAGAPALGGPGHEAVLGTYAAEVRKANPGFAGFSAERGGAFFRARHTGGEAKTPSCTTCHGSDPRVAGQSEKTGKAIEPMAISANPQRYTNAADVEKWFGRNCKQVLGRDCTAEEKGDFIDFMVKQ